MRLSCINQIELTHFLIVNDDPSLSDDPPPKTIQCDVFCHTERNLRVSDLGNFCFQRFFKQPSITDKGISLLWIQVLYVA